ncbi:hypothetical protein ABZS81_30480 [Streptomyces sp. NPDC005318]|uniref:hypothetical protein n=1 Tax=Streptomyces sp. NPDC005318 TaxID=3157031 RepID=UPI0033A25B2D
MNEPGLTWCSFCDAELPVAAPSDVTPRPIGVHTNDGSLVILVEAGTRYPTDQQVRHDFQVTSNPGDMLEIALHEGNLQPAERNDLCGVSMYELPEGSAETKALTIAVHLDKDRSIQRETRLDGASFSRAVFRRNPLPPEFRNLKKSALDSIDNPQFRLPHGRVAQTLLNAVIIFVANLRAIERFRRDQGIQPRRISTPRTAPQSGQPADPPRSEPLPAGQAKPPPRE